MTPPKFYTKTQISLLKVEELKRALNDRGLDICGSRPELQQRLRHHIHPLSLSQPNVTNVTKNCNKPSVLNDLNISTQLPSASETDQWDIIKVKQGPVFKRIPKGSRLQSCIAFTKILNNVISKK